MPVWPVHIPMSHRTLSPLLALLTTTMLSTVLAADSAALSAANPFAVPTTLPFNYPRFDRIKDSDFAPAFDAGMAQQLAEIRGIADNPAAPTFQNTLVALEKSGLLLQRAKRVFDALVSADTNDARNQLRKDYAPRFAAHQDAIRLDGRLFARIETLYGRRATLGLDAESLRLLERTHADFVHAGARLSAGDKE